MAQQDYVRRNQLVSSRRHKNSLRKKQSTFPPFSIKKGAIAVVVLMFLIFSGLYFITRHTKEESEEIQKKKVISDGLPPKPEERWNYIKELENRQLDNKNQPIKTSNSGEIKNLNAPNDKQRHLWKQIQTDMHLQSTQLNNAAPWREQTPTQSERQIQNQQQQWINTHSNQQQEKSQDYFGVRKKNDPLARTDEQNWIVQCGSFKAADQAETRRAQLIFEGFDSHVTTNNGWNRVVIGPMKGKNDADSTIARLKTDGHINCVRFASGG